MFHGDNLPFLRGINSGTIHLIATDPPFNKNRDFHATPDSLASGARFQDRWRWEDDVHEEWIDSIKDDWSAAWAVIEMSRQAYGDDMGAFLCWLGVRLMEMHRILRDDGSIYLHIDHTAHAYVKALMDAIFGKRNFRNEIVWAYTGPGSPKMRQFNRKHDSILWYNKGKSWVFNGNDVRIEYKDGKPHTGGFRHVTGSKAGTNMNQEVADSYTYKGKIPEDWWNDIALAVRSSKERLGYPTQKPLKLYERIILASSNVGNIVLDPFCGCATTPIAAERLGRQWIGIDIWDNAYKVVLERLQGEGLAGPVSTPDRLITFGDITYSKTPPDRTDQNDVAAPSLKLKIQRPTEPWEKMSHREITNVLVNAQSTSDGVICAGCGRTLEKEFMELDHITPKSDRGANHILNRILLCRPCNGRKRDSLTLRGLVRANKRANWMRDEMWAINARDRAALRAEWVRDNFGTLECESLMRASN